MNKAQYYRSDYGPYTSNPMWVMIINYTDAEIAIDEHAGFPQECQTFEEVCSYILVPERASFALELEGKEIISFSEVLREKIVGWQNSHSQTKE